MEAADPVILGGQSPTLLDYIPSFCVPYLVLIFNTLVFHILRRVLLRFSPIAIQIVIAEIIATLELCADCAELGLVYELHGYLGLGAGLLALCFWWCSVWGDAEACPCGPIEEVVFGAGGKRKAAKQLFGQAVGGALTTLYLNSIWALTLEPEALLAECQAGLQVSMGFGALIEGFITMISRMVALESVHWLPHISLSLNAIVTTILVLAATSTTGGFFNPVLATALTLGCKGNTLVEHVVVYWVGSLVGGFIGRHYANVRNASYEHLKDKYA